MTSTASLTLVQQLLEEMQQAVRAKDHAAALDLFTHDATLVGTSAANLDAESISSYLVLILEHPGHLQWDWEQVSVLDARPGAVTFLALGSIRWADCPEDDGVDPIRLTCLAVEETDRWRLRLFHGSVPSP